MFQRNKSETHRKLAEFAKLEKEQRRRLARVARRKWFKRVATDSFSNMLGTLIAAGVGVLFASLIGAIHVLTTRELLLIALATLFLLLVTSAGAVGFRTWRFTRGIDAHVKDLEEFMSRAVKQAEEREAEIQAMQTDDG
jgi:uncharacterized membrane protein YkgB